MTTGWGDGLSEWWLREVHDDPAYREVVTPLIIELIGPLRPGPVLDVGCGEGRVMRTLRQAGWEAVGVDPDLDLLSRSPATAFRARAPELGMVRDGALAGVVISLVLEHLLDHRPVLAECARMVRPGGFLVLVVNHPVFTAPGAAPVIDADGETLWRTGEYFSDGYTDEPAGEGTVRFHHRSMSDLLNGAAAAGWALERMIEKGPSGGQISLYPGFAEQRHIPRLLGVRWANGRSAP